MNTAPSFARPICALDSKSEVDQWEIDDVRGVDVFSVFLLLMTPLKYSQKVSVMVLRNVYTCTYMKYATINGVKIDHHRAWLTHSC
jgi:hypothetical protein